MPPIRLLIADDHTLFRRGLASLLSESGEFDVAGEADSGPEAVQLARDLRPDVILMDVHMPAGDGVEAVRQLQASLPDLPVIMLTVSQQDEDLVGAIRAGARGYLLKNADTEALYTAIRQAAAGQAVLDPALTQRVFSHIVKAAQPADDTPLTLRETEILQLAAEGCTNREIAFRLNISENTVKSHIANVLSKLEAASRSEAAARARARGWLPPD